MFTGNSNVFEWMFVMDGKKPERSTTSKLQTQTVSQCLGASMRIRGVLEQTTVHNLGCVTNAPIQEVVARRSRSLASSPPPPSVPLSDLGLQSSGGQERREKRIKTDHQVVAFAWASGLNVRQNLQEHASVAPIQSGGTSGASRPAETVRRLPSVLQVLECALKGEEPSKLMSSACSNVPHR